MPSPKKQITVLLRTADDPNDPLTVHSARLDLPATPAKMLQALNRLGRNYPDEDVEIRIEDTAKEYLRHLIGASPPELMKVDLLAKKLADMDSADAAVFHALTKIYPNATEAPHLINLTYAVDACHVASSVSNTEQLGRFLYENEILPEDAMRMARPSRPSACILTSISPCLAASTVRQCTASLWTAHT